MTHEPGGGSRDDENRAVAADREHLDECLRQAGLARGGTSPNPLVGAVVVGRGEVVARAYHRCAGQAHAERLALAEAGELARGATLYTNIEPCCHYGRTPPCVEAIVEAGITRVVSCTIDPDPRVNGRGFGFLRDAGIEVSSGLRAREAAELNEGYFMLKASGRPFVVAKAALSLDGRMATRTRQSQWITGAEARQFGHRLRAGCDAVVVGSGTLLADDPRLTARVADKAAGQGPACRVIFDSQLRTPPGARILHEQVGRVLIFTVASAARTATARATDQHAALLAAGAEIFVTEPDAAGRVDLPAALVQMADLGIATVLIEGGSALLTSAFEVDIIDKLFLFYAPMLMGGADALPLWGGDGVADLADAPRLQRVRHHRVGEDWIIEGYIRPPTPPTSAPSDRATG